MKAWMVVDTKIVALGFSRRVLRQESHEIKGGHL